MNKYIVKIKPILRPFNNARLILRKKLYDLLPKLSLNDLEQIFDKELDVKKGETLFIHSSLNTLNTELSPIELIHFIKDYIGSDGTIIMPTFSSDTVDSLNGSPGEFSVKETLSNVGYLTNVFMKQPDVLRSVHPIKSCAAWGANASFLLGEHHLSKLPYDKKSPFYKITLLKNAKVIGLGVTSWILSFQHSVHDTFHHFPVNIHTEQVYDFDCITANGEKINVTTPFDLPDVIALRNNSLIKKYYKKDEWLDFQYKLRPFFRVHAKTYYEKALDMAMRGITVYGEFKSTSKTVSV